MSADPPYPELKKSHTTAHAGRPWRDYKPPSSGSVWGLLQAGNTCWMLVAAIDLDIFDALEAKGKRRAATLADDLSVSANQICTFLIQALVARPGRY